MRWTAGDRTYRLRHGEVEATGNTGRTKSGSRRVLVLVLLLLLLNAVQCEAGPRFSLCSSMLKHTQREERCCRMIVARM